LVTISTAEQNVTTAIANLIHFLNDGSKYHGYKDSSAQPYLNYVLATQPVVNLGKEPGTPTNDGAPYPNGKRYPWYGSIFAQNNVCNWVDNHGVREIWLYGYRSPTLGMPESQMSSGQYGNIANSLSEANLGIPPQYRMPVCNHSYTVYTYEYQQLTNGSEIGNEVHDHMHQLENLVWFGAGDVPYPDGQVPANQQGIFWGNFATFNRSQNGCGSTHNPPNTNVTTQYHYGETNTVSSNCEDWPNNNYQPVSCSNWGCTGANDVNYYKWWMQNLSGYYNNITYQGHGMRNWWDLVADFDWFIAGGGRTLLCDRVNCLTTAPPSPSCTPSNVSFSCTATGIAVNWNTGICTDTTFTINTKNPSGAWGTEIPVAATCVNNSCSGSLSLPGSTSVVEAAVWQTSQKDLNQRGYSASAACIVGSDNSIPTITTNPTPTSSQNPINGEGTPQNAITTGYCSGYNGGNGNNQCYCQPVSVSTTGNSCSNTSVTLNWNGANCLYCGYTLKWTDGQGSSHSKDYFVPNADCNNKKNEISYFQNITTSLSDQNGISNVSVMPYGTTQITTVGVSACSLENTIITPTPTVNAPSITPTPTIPSVVQPPVVPATSTSSNATGYCSPYSQSAHDSQCYCQPVTVSATQNVCNSGKVTSTSVVWNGANCLYCGYTLQWTDTTGSSHTKDYWVPDSQCGTPDQKRANISSFQNISTSISEPNGIQSITVMPYGDSRGTSVRLNACTAQ